MSNAPISALKAYQSALQKVRQADEQIKGQGLASQEEQNSGFADIIKDSVAKVNNMELNKEEMIKSFASGETQNVHELMIGLQKASLAMSMTSAVRNKVMQAYKEVMQMHF